MKDTAHDPATRLARAERRWLADARIRLRSTAARLTPPAELTRTELTRTERARTERARTEREDER